MRSPNWRWAKALLASTPAAFRISVFTLLSPPFRSFSSTLIAEICNRHRPLLPQCSSFYNVGIHISISVLTLLSPPFRSFSSTLIAEICTRHRPLLPQRSSSYNVGIHIRISVLTLLRPPFRSFSSTLTAEICNRRRQSHPQSSSLLEHCCVPLAGPLSRCFTCGWCESLGP